MLEGKGVTSSSAAWSPASRILSLIVDPPSLMLGAAQGMPVRTVARNSYQISPNALISWKDQNISKPAVIVGKAVATLQGDTTTTMLYALLAKNQIDRNSVHIVASDGGTRNQTLPRQARRSDHRIHQRLVHRPCRDHQQCRDHVP